MKVSPEIIDELSTTMLLIRQHEVQIKALRAHVASLIREETGVDINRGQWSLDLEKGEIAPKDEAK